VPLLEQSSTVILIPSSRAALSSAPGGIMAMGGDGFAGALRERIFCVAGWPGCWSGIHTGMSSRCRAPRALTDEWIGGGASKLASRSVVVENGSRLPVATATATVKTRKSCQCQRALSGLPVQCRAQLRELDALAAAQSTITRIQKPTRSQGSVRRVDIFVISYPSRSGAAPRYSGRPRSATDRHSHTGRPHWMHHHHHRNDAAMCAPPGRRRLRVGGRVLRGALPLAPCTHARVHELWPGGGSRTDGADQARTHARTTARARRLPCFSRVLPRAARQSSERVERLRAATCAASPVPGG
jgi:hypothetical protein